MDINNIQLGDILAFKGHLPHSQIIKSLTNSNYSHVCLYIGNGQLVEADFGGIKYRDISDYNNYLDVYTCPSLTDQQRKIICDYAISKVGEKYDYFLLLYLFFKSLFKLRFRLKDRKADICSELVNDSYAESGVILSKKKYPNPQEIISSKLLRFDGSY